MSFTIRPFVNADPPRLFGVLRRALSVAHIASVAEMQEGFFGLPYSDHNGMWVAVDDESQQVIGFALCGPAPRRDGGDLDVQRGIVRLVVIDPDVSEPQPLAVALIRRCEERLVANGATSILAGTSHSCIPFSMGLFGLLEEVPCPEENSPVHRAFLECGFRSDQEVHRFSRSLVGYRPKFTAKVVRQRNLLDLHFDDHPKPRHWWEACLMAYHQWLEVTVHRTDHALGLAAPAIARVATCVSIPRSTKAFYSTPRRAGIINVQVDPEFQRQGVATYLLGETLRFLSNECQVKSVEAYVASEFESLIALLEHEGWNRLPPQSLLVKDAIA